MGKFIIGVLIGIIILPMGAYLYLQSGYAPVATSAPPMPFERFLAKTALHAALRREAPKTHTTTGSPALLAEGAEVFTHNCAVCHGLPGQPPTAIAKGEFPPPPQLFTQRGMVTDDPVGVTYWKVKHGIRLTGMPGFDPSLTDEQIWAVSLLMRNADHLTPALQAILSPQPPSPPQAVQTKKAAPKRK